MQRRLARNSPPPHLHKKSIESEFIPGSCQGWRLLLKFGHTPHAYRSIRNAFMQKAGAKLIIADFFCLLYFIVTITTLFIYGVFRLHKPLLMAFRRCDWSTCESCIIEITKPFFYVI